MSEQLTANVLKEALTLGLSFDDCLTKLVSKSLIVETRSVSEIDRAYMIAKKLHSMALLTGVDYDTTVQDLYKKCADVNQWDGWSTLGASMRKRIGMQFGLRVRKYQSDTGRRVIRVGQTQQNNTLYKTVDK